MSRSFWYPSVDDVLNIHEDIVSEYPDTSPGVRNSGDVEFALEFISQGSFGEVPDTIHEKAFHLLRLLVANHPFVDANKRTALNTAVVFYLLNGYRFEYDDEIGGILKQFGTDETTVDEVDVLEYLRTNTADVDLNEVIAEWRIDLVEYGLDQLSDDVTDPND
jgi:death-on-curing protein